MTHVTKRISLGSDIDVKSVIRISCVKTVSGVVKFRERITMITKQESIVVLYVLLIILIFFFEIFKLALFLIFDDF